MKAIDATHIQKLDHMLLKSAKTVIVTHMKPDGDAAGSTTAMYHFIRQHTGADVKIVLNDRFQKVLEFLLDEDSAKDICIYSEDAAAAAGHIASADTIICLDFNAFHRTDGLEAVLSASEAEKVLIDHHLNPDREKFTLCFSETEISSASELTYQILMQTPQTEGDASRLPAESALALMTGMTTDTNNFANSVYPSTLRMASELIEAGVDRDLILSNLYNQHSETRMRLMGHVLKDLMTITRDGVAYIVLDRKTLQEYPIEEGDTEGFVNLPLSIAKVKMSLLLKEDGNKVRVSIRSKKGISANRCSRLHFNGGGHENAAGGRLHIPEDIAGMEEAAAYVEAHTHKFMTDEN